VEIMLAPESAARIRAVLGDAVDLSPPAVPGALARLADEAPDVYSAVLNELSGSDIRLDSERVLHRRHRRTMLRRLLFGWGEYESDAGDRLLAKRRVAAAVPIGLAFTLIAAAGLAGLTHHGHRLSSVASVHADRAPRTPKVTPGAVHRRPITPASLWSGLLSGRAAMAATPSAVRPSPPLPLVPALPVPPPTGVTFRQGGDAPPPSIVFSRAPSPGTAASQAAARSPLPPIVYARDGEADAGGSPAQQTVAARRTAPGAAAAPGAANANAAFRAGDMIAARLLTGIIVAAGVPSVPVVAAAGGGVKWLGRAVAGADGRVDISFTAPAAGMALDPEGLAAGLPGKTVIRRRGAAVAAIAAVAQAAADYAQAVARAGQVTVAKGRRRSPSAAQRRDGPMRRHVWPTR